VPLKIRIRDPNGRPSWTKHPTQDVAVVGLSATVGHIPALPVSELPGERALEVLGVVPGDEMMVLGYPRGLSANAQGFPILSAGKVASYPLSPAERYPTYLVNMNVHAGNSGGPVYIVLPSSTATRPEAQVVVTGLLTQQIKYNGDRLAIGNVTQADFISETVSLMAASDLLDPAPANVAASTDYVEQSSHKPAATWLQKLHTLWSVSLEKADLFLRRTWIALRDRVNGWVTPDPRPSSILPGA
jgi:hypothetical protein